MTTRRAAPKKRTRPAKTGFRVHRFAGVALGGGKTEKTAVAILEYYPEQKRVFLRALRERLKGEGETSSDQALFHFLTAEEPGLEIIAMDAPLQLPKCLRCELVCPGYEACKLVEIRWLWARHEERGKEKRPNKLFTPYTERCAEVYLATQLEESFHPPHAMGANAAPLTARAHFLRRRIEQSWKSGWEPELVEVYPKLALWRIGRDLKVPKSHLRFHRHAIDSDEARHYLIKQLIDSEIAFVYQQDLKTLVENPQAFDAFICALTAFLKFRGQTEPRPSGFPRDELWIEFPRSEIDWF